MEEVEMDYKDTLLMPKTEFPMRGNLPKREPEIQQKWEEMDIYRKVQERTKGRRYLFYMTVLHMQTVISIWAMP